MPLWHWRECAALPGAMIFARHGTTRHNGRAADWLRHPEHDTVSLGRKYNS